MGMPRQCKNRLVGMKKDGQPPSIETSTQPPCDETATAKDVPASHYETLEVPDTANSLEVHAAYKRRALLTHPDKGGVAAEFQRVLDAFQTLSDAARRKLYDYDQQQSSPIRSSKASRKPRAQSRLECMLMQKLTSLLKKMSTDCRRDTIMRRLSAQQRAALEKHMHDEKATSCKSTDLEMCESDCRTGVYRASRSGGYYAKVFVYSLALQAHVRKDLVDALNDHAALTKVAEHLRRSYFELVAAQRDHPSALQLDLWTGLIASVQVFFYNRHFIGHRHLQLNFKTLTEGLDAWEEMQTAKGMTLFTGNGVTDAYSPEAAEQQWRRVKETYLRFAVGRRSSRAEIEEQLSFWEKQQLPIRLQRDCKLWQRCNDRATKATTHLDSESTDGELVRRVESLLKRQARLASCPQLVEKVQICRKRLHEELQ